MKFPFLLLGSLDLVPSHAGLFEAFRGPWDSCYLDSGIHKIVSLQTAGHPLSYDAEEILTLYIKQADGVELVYICGDVLFLGSGLLLTCATLWV